jgi:hypothetical protein
MGSPQAALDCEEMPHIALPEGLPGITSGFARQTADSNRSAAAFEPYETLLV